MATPDEIDAALEPEWAGPPDERREPTQEDRICARMLRNDIGNGERLRARYGRDLAFVPGLGWLAWARTHWDGETGEAEARKRAQLTARGIFAEALTIEAPPAGDQKALAIYEMRVEAVRRFAKSSGNSGKLSAMLQEAAPHLSQRHDAFDADVFALNTPGRTLRLLPDGKAEARVPARGDRITKLAGAKFVPGAEAPGWCAFLERMQPDPAVRAFLQRWAGLMLTGSVAENVFAIHFGTGRNGKGTFLNALRSVLGDYGAFVNIATVGADRAKRSGGEASPDVMRMRGARMVQLSDAPGGFELEEGFVKQITGNEPIVARALQQAPVEFRPQFKLNFTCNVKPKIKGADDGIWRRVVLIDWPVQIAAGDEDHGLAAALEAEGAGILNWMIEGYARWRSQGLSPPPSVRAAVESYRRESDAVGEFLSLWVDRDPVKSVLSKTLFAKYVDYCRDDGLPEPKSAATFGRALNARGFRSSRTHGGVKCFKGLHLRDTPRDVEALDFGSGSAVNARAEIVHPSVHPRAQSFTTGRGQWVDGAWVEDDDTS